MPRYTHTLSEKRLRSFSVPIKYGSHPSTLFRIFSKHTPRLVSIVAPQVTVHWTDLEKIAPRLIYSSLSGLYVGEFRKLDARFIQENFPQSLAFNFHRGTWTS